MQQEGGSKPAVLFLHLQAKHLQHVGGRSILSSQPWTPISTSHVVCFEAVTHVIVAVWEQEQKAKAATVAAMQERAAQEYRQEAARIAESAAKAASDATAKAKARAKQKMKSVAPASSSHLASGPSNTAAGKFDFGGVRGSGSESSAPGTAVAGSGHPRDYPPGPQILTSSGGSYPQPPPARRYQEPGLQGKASGGYYAEGGLAGGLATGQDKAGNYIPPQPAWEAGAGNDDDEAALNEAIQLSLALEESRRMYEAEQNFSHSVVRFAAGRCILVNAWYLIPLNGMSTGHTQSVKGSPCATIYFHIACWVAFTT